MAGPVLQGVLQFGSHLIPRSQVFLLTPLSFAFTNRKPILPGRILPVLYRMTCVVHVYVGDTTEGEPFVSTIARLSVLALYTQHCRSYLSALCSISHKFSPSLVAQIPEQTQLSSLVWS
jgi:hypothetical protein